MPKRSLRPPAPPPGRRAAELYLDLLKGCLTRELFIDEEYVDAAWWPDSLPLGDPDEVWRAIEDQGSNLRVVRPNRKRQARKDGRDAPPTAETMIGRKRLDNVHELAVRVLVEDVPGDFVETGVWRGGTIAFLRAVLAAYDDDDRRVWACDSFQGLPEPDVERFPIDHTLHLDSTPGSDDANLKVQLAVSAKQVRANIRRYGLLDRRIEFLEGWFADTLPDAPIERISLLRLDGDLYQSTIESLTHLEPKVSPGGFIVVDDYNGLEACRQAVTDYRRDHGIEDEIHEVDWTGAWWRKGG